MTSALVNLSELLNAETKVIIGWLRMTKVAISEVFNYGDSVHQNIYYIRHIEYFNIVVVYENLHDMNAWILQLNG